MRVFLDIEGGFKGGVLRLAGPVKGDRPPDVDGAFLSQAFLPPRAINLWNSASSDCEHSSPGDIDPDTFADWDRLRFVAGLLRSLKEMLLRLLSLADVELSNRRR